MGLKPLEFSDCLLDSPYFRESIHDHEKELDQANSAIKSLIRECQNLIKSLESKIILFNFDFYLYTFLQFFSLIVYMTYFYYYITIYFITPSYKYVTIKLHDVVQLFYYCFIT